MTTTHSPVRPWLLAAGPALVLAAGAGALAARARTDAPDGVTFAVFAVMTFPFLLALGAIALDRTKHPEQEEESIERQWTTAASSGAFFDTMVAMGLATFATSLLDTGSLPAWVFIVLGLTDFTVRLVLLQRRQG